MDLNDFLVGRRVNPAVWATWTVLATATGDATDYRVCTDDDTVYHVVECPHGPDEVIVAVSDHGDYVSALRAVAACIEHPEGRRALASLDFRPRLRIKRTWYIDKGPYTSMYGVDLELLYVTAHELDGLHAAYGSTASEEGN